MQRIGFAVCLLVSFSTSARAGDLEPILGPGDSDGLPLVRTSVLQDQIENAHSVYPVFGQLPDSRGKDLFLGFRVNGVAEAKNKRGRLRVFPNRGTIDEPRYGNGSWLDDNVPSARIPSG